MSTLICKATGLLSAAATWGVAEVGTGALNLIRFNHNQTIVAAGTQASATFTVTTAKVIDGVLLWVRQGQTGSTGTFKVDLQKGGVSQASVTVNKVDLPDVGVGNQNAPVFFKFTGTATGDGAANWTIVLTTTGTGTVFYCLNASGATNFTRALRTTTTAAPVATDDLYVTGELSGAGTHNSFTVTMDSTAATVYGNGTVNSTTVNGGLIAISNWGTLSYGTTASTNYILRVAGDIRVNQYGTLNIGAAGAEIPRNSTAVLEFQPVSADGDFGLYAYDYATVNIAGLSRTSGKNVVKCKMTSDWTSNSTITFGSSTNITSNNSTFMDATGTSLLAPSPNENATNATHGVYYQGASVTNVTQVATIWLAQGSGPANNRYVRLTLGNNPLYTSITNGFWSDIDLQAGTASAITNIGTGVGASVTIVAQGAGWLIRLTGKVSTTTATPAFLINCCSAVGTLSYAGSAANFNFVYDHVSLVTAASISDTTVNVDADTGWLSGDVICVSSTTRTPLESELLALNANAGASSFTSALYSTGAAGNGALNFTRSGTSPTQAEIGLLTRNVRIRSTSTSFMMFFYASALATVTASWAEFYRFASSVAGRRGIELDAGLIANPKSFTYCSMREFETGAAFYSSAGSTSLNVMFANNVTWNMIASVNFISTIANADWTIDNCLFMRNAGTAVSLADIGGTFTNNTSCSATTGNQISLAETNGVLGTFDNNTIHSGGTAGFIFSANGMAGTLSNCKVWRMAGGNGGLWFNGMCPDFVFTDLTLFGNNTTNVVYGTTGGSINIIGATIAGETSYPTTNGFAFTGGMVGINLTNVDMSGVGGTLAPHTVDFSFPSAPAEPIGRINNCKFGAATVFSKVFWDSTAYMGFANYNQVVGDHRCEMKYGQIKTDSVIFNTAAPSMRMSPNDSVNKLESAPELLGVKVPVASGVAVDVSVWTKKSDTAAGTNYAGGQPRLIQRANAVLGQNTDVVLATDSSTPSGSLVPTTWDTATAALVTLSNGNLTVTNTGGSAGEQGARAAAAPKSSGKHYFEITITTSGGGGNTGVGICTTGSSYTNMGASATTGVSIFTSGNIWSNGSNTSINPGSWTSGSLICIAVDLDNRKMWYRIGAAGNWNGNVANNPATNVGGVNIPAGTMVPVCHFNAAGSVFTANFGATAFTGAVPSGFTSGWLAATSTSTWIQLTGTSSNPTSDGVWEFIVDCDGSAGWLNVDDWQFTGVATTANGMKNWYGGVPLVGGSGGGGGGVPGYFAGGFTG